MKQTLKNLLYLYILAALAAALLLLLYWELKPHPDTAGDRTARLEAAIGGEYQKARETSVSSVRFSDGAGGEIYEYIYTSTYYTEDIPALDGPDMVICTCFMPRGEGRERCRVGEFDALRSCADGRSYLFWSISPTHSLMLSCPDTLPDAELFAMAESIGLK